MNDYIYLISSLPMLHFIGKPPSSFEKFITICRGLIPQADLEIIQASNISGDYLQAEQKTLQAWRDFDTGLRNALVKLRASRKHIPVASHLRQEIFLGQTIVHLALAAQKNIYPLEAEKLLDEARWNFLEEISFGHYFDLDHLIIYAHKLLLLEKWARINTADTQALIEGVLSIG